MKKTFAIVAINSLLALNVIAAPATTLSLSTFGNSADAFSSNGWSYNATTSVLSGSNTIDSLIFNASGSPWDLTSVGTTNSISLQLVLQAFPTSTTGSFNITLEDNTGLQYISPTWNWSEFSSTVSVQKLYSSGTIPTGFNPTSIQNWNINSTSASGTVNVGLSQFNVVNSVPEPGTYILLSIVGLFFVVYRRRAV